MNVVVVLMMAAVDFYCREIGGRMGHEPLFLRESSAKLKLTLRSDLTPRPVYCTS